MELRDMGWNDKLQEAFDGMGLSDVIIGRVVTVSTSTYSILTENGEMEARVSGRLRSESVPHTSLPCVGDWVLIRKVGLKNMIFHVMDRYSMISRKAPGKSSSEQLIAANIDLIFIVMGLDSDLNPRRLERYLVMVSGTGASPVVILNKADILEDELRPDEIDDICGDVPFHMISALEGDGLDIVRRYLSPGKTIALVGSSGAGKSTLINSLLGYEKQRTGSVRDGDDKGRHVTTSRELFIIPGGGMIIDNPGIREIQLVNDPSSLEDAFPDIRELAKGCKFRDCFHLHEPQCRVQEALKKGSLNKERYENFQKMRRELDYMMRRSASTSEAIEKMRWKTVKKGVKNFYRYKKEGR